ncbi:hypothetical protein HMPREF2997_03320 [Staphylococcus sp. HMSC057C08]|uniref:hypothetical protein n=1 Tax=Staphylococcus sp. HMSC057C08 TaxID=1739501 RepID=UPI0008A2DED8|nr:hypothetical protein [Staphylococcus sp. HMSC057C08]OFP27920.1 hypothetical protein HMPREF2997_03320 [Staphylococcus sp. HMSC057C08]
MHKSFWIAYVFCFVSTTILTFVTQDFILSSAISLLLSLAVYLFFLVWYYEVDIFNDEGEVVDDGEEYITLFIIKY